MELDQLNVNELEILRDKILREIEKRNLLIKREGIEKIKVIVEEYGLNTDELKSLAVKNKYTSKRGTVAPKYRDPNNSANTWTGRGRRPKWVEIFLEAGGQLNQITI